MFPVMQAMTEEKHEVKEQDAHFDFSGTGTTGWNAEYEKIGEKFVGARNSTGLRRRERIELPSARRRGGWPLMIKTSDGLRAY